jgi:hypothetical protein
MAAERSKTIRLGVVERRDGGGDFFDTSSELPEGSPILCGPGTLEQLCGQCDRILIRGFEVGQLSRVILRCPTCGAHNSTDPRRLTSASEQGEASS